MRIVVSMTLQAHEVAQVAERVPDAMFGTKDLQDLVQRMIAAMREAPGVGLAAPQIGVSMQVCSPGDSTHFLFHCLFLSLIPCPWLPESCCSGINATQKKLCVLLRILRV